MSVVTPLSAEAAQTFIRRHTGRDCYCGGSSSVPFSNLMSQCFRLIASLQSTAHESGLALIHTNHGIARSVDGATEMSKGLAHLMGENESNFKIAAQQSGLFGGPFNQRVYTPSTVTCDY